MDYITNQVLEKFYLEIGSIADSLVRIAEALEDIKEEL
jgi:hypothetical protein